MTLLLDPADPIVAAWAMGFHPARRAASPRRQRENVREADRRRRFARIIAAHELGHRVDRDLLAQALADREARRQRVRQCKARAPHTKERARHYSNLYHARKAVAAGLPLTDCQRAAVMAEAARNQIDQTAAGCAEKESPDA